MSPVQAQAVLMRAEGATYAQICEELVITEEQAREYAPFPAQLGAGQVREEMRNAIVTGDRIKLAEAFEQHGLGLREVLDQHRECMYAKQYFFDKETGKFFSQPDHKTINTAVRTWYQVNGLIGEKRQEGDQQKPVQLHLHQHTVGMVENLTGRKLLPEGEGHDGHEHAGNGRAGDGHLPAVRSYAEPVPQGIAGNRKEQDGAALRAEPVHHTDRPKHRPAAKGSAGANDAGAPGDDWGDF
jgi:hypothetical protein